MKIINILCFDQATKTSGYSLFNEKKLITYGIIQADEEESNPLERMRQMRLEMIRILEEYKPDFVVFEDTQFQNNYGTFQQLSQLQGILVSLLFERDIGFCIVQPTKWKSTAGVRGRKRIEQKKSAIQIVQNKYKIEPSEDEADAILIGVWAINNIAIKNK